MCHRKPYYYLLTFIVSVLLISCIGCENSPTESHNDNYDDNNNYYDNDNEDNRNNSPIIEYKTVSFSLSKLTACPTWTRGDREFNGHGPRVVFGASLRISSNRKSIYLNINFKAEETRSDYTTAEYHKSSKIFAASGDWTIDKINSSTSSRATYIDTDHSFDYPRITNGNLVRTLKVMGDSYGKDVGGVCYTNDCHFIVWFNTVEVKLKRTVY